MAVVGPAQSQDPKPESEANTEREGDDEGKTNNEQTHETKRNERSE